MVSMLLIVQYAKFVKPAFDDFILPSKKYADVIIPRGGDNHVAIDLIVQHIRTKLGQHELCKIYPNVYVIQSTFQVCSFAIYFINQLAFWSILALPLLKNSDALISGSYFQSLKSIFATNFLSIVCVH